MRTLGDRHRRDLTRAHSNIARQIEHSTKAACRKGSPNPELLDRRQQALLQSIIDHAPYQLGRNNSLPGYALSNLGGNINRQRKRLACLEREAGL